MLKLGILGSGSLGNSALIVSEKICLLIDAGLSAKQINLRLESLGYSLENLDGILLTHEHGDHTRGLEVLCKKKKVPIYCNPLTQEILQQTIREELDWRLIPSGESFLLKEITIDTFPVPHDAVDPIGFVIGDTESKIGILSDVGYVTNLIKNRLVGVHTLFIEANYDEVLLHNDTKRPWSTKQRISSRHGHLSNEQAIELIDEVAGECLQQIVFGHLSQDCNDEELLTKKIRHILEKKELHDVRVYCAQQSQPSKLLPARRAKTEKRMSASSLVQQSDLFADQ